MKNDEYISETARRLFSPSKDIVRSPELTEDVLSQQIPSNFIETDDCPSSKRIQGKPQLRIIDGEKSFPKKPTDIPFENLEEKVYKPSVLDIKNYASSMVEGKKQKRFLPVVDEVRNVLAQTFCLAGKINYLSKGNSGSGKSHLTDKVLALLPDDFVYKAGLSSETALYRDAERINRARVVYIPELQKAVSKKSSCIVELIKDVTEGKNSERTRVSPNGAIVVDLITSDKIVVATLANENNYCKDEDLELKRRFLELSTNQSEDHLRMVINYKAEQRGPNRNRTVFSATDYERLSHHIVECLNLEVDFVDPFYTSLSTIIPETPKSLSYSEHYYNLLNACATFHYKERHIENNTLFISLEDHFIVHEIYHNSFCDSLLEFDNEERWVQRIQESKKSVDWKSWWNEGCKIMESAYDSQTVSSWKNSQLDGENILLSNPHNGEKITLHYQ